MAVIERINRRTDAIREIQVAISAAETYAEIGAAWGEYGSLLEATQKVQIASEMVLAIGSSAPVEFAYVAIKGGIESSWRPIASWSGEEAAEGALANYVGEETASAFGVLWEAAQALGDWTTASIEGREFRAETDARFFVNRSYVSSMRRQLESLREAQEKDQELWNRLTNGNQR